MRIFDGPDKREIVRRRNNNIVMFTLIGSVQCRVTGIHNIPIKIYQTRQYTYTVLAIIK